MPPAEWPHRAREAALILAERARPPRLAAIPVEAARGWARPPGAAALVIESDVEAVRALPGAVETAAGTAEAFLTGRFRFFGYPEVRLPPQPDWHDDPVARIRWPSAHWSRIDHRTAAADPKWIWELGRHQHVVHLARAWRLSGDERFAEAARLHLGGFLAQCPPGVGIHWRSGLELGVRLISWAWAVEFLRGSPVLDGRLRSDLLGSVQGHLDHLMRYPSRHSSANNHLVGEAAGLAVGGLSFPELPNAAPAAARGLSELERALSAQVLPDGVDAEQAVGYQGFVLDLGLAVAACLRGSGRALPDGLARPLRGLAGFLGTLASDAGTLPRIGDEDEGLGVDLSSFAQEAERLWSRLRSTEALVGGGDRREPGLDEQTIWLAGHEAAARVAALPRARPGSAVFPSGGYAVLRARDGDDHELRAVLDAGPLGLPPLYAHGHADLLAVCLSVDGEEAVVDAGTFTYFGDLRWREYGRSTAAHSTLRIDGREQAAQAGRFMWRTAPAARLDGARLEDGRLAARAHHLAFAPIRHEREVELSGRVLTVVDRLDGPPGEHDVELRWHLGPGSIAEVPGGWLWRGEGAALAVAVDGLGSLRSVTGCVSLPLGFVSTGLERRRAAPALLAAARLRLPAVVVSTLAAGERVVPPAGRVALTR
jgi:hypothetical protein